MPTKPELITNMKTSLAEARKHLDAGDETAAQHHLNTANSCKQQIQDLGFMDALTDLTGQMNGGTKVRPANRGTAWSKAAMDNIRKVNEASGVKALVTGSIAVPSPLFGSEIIPGAKAPNRLLDLVVDRTPTGSNVFNYLRQTVRDGNAAPVADNALKPTSVYTIAEIEDRVRVIAHLSEAIPERYFADDAELERFLTTEMEEGLYRAVEDQVINGDGLGENMTGLGSVSGVLAQAWTSNMLGTLRRAVTAMAVVGEIPTAWAISPADTEALDLLTDNEARMYYDGPQQQLTTAPLWSLPVVQSLAVPAGTAWLGDWAQLSLIVRDDARLDVDRGGELFTKNQVKLRVEGRYGVAVRRATAFCQVDLVA